MDIKIHVFHTGRVAVSPYLPFGGEKCSPLRASGIFASAESRLWLPVTAYLIEIGGRRVLFDCGWHRDMSPAGVLDRAAQIRSLGSRLLYMTNQGIVPKGAAVDEQLAAMGITPDSLDIVLLSHLDCDHANGLKLVSAAREILVSADELKFARKRTLTNLIRYQSKWWAGTKIKGFDWNGTEGPAGRSYDVLGDGSLQLINIPGHSPGLCALKITNPAGRYVLLYADGGYATRSWQEGILSGIADDRAAQKSSLAYIREQSLNPNCVASLATHDPDVAPQIITL